MRGKKERGEEGTGRDWIEGEKWKDRRNRMRYRNRI